MPPGLKGTYVGGHQHPHGGGTEGVQCAQALALLQLGVDGPAIDAHGTE
jgi:hypothetical protein